MKILNAISLSLNRLFTAIGGIFLLGMILLTCANIVLRATWVPIRGTFELMGFFGAIVIAFALGYTQVKRGHIAVDVLVNTFSPKGRKIVNILNNIICLLFFFVAAWQLLKKATILKNTGEVTETLRVIYHPFVYAAALGCGLLAFVFLTDIGKLLFPEIKKVSEQSEVPGRVYAAGKEVIEEI